MFRNAKFGLLKVEFDKGKAFPITDNHFSEYLPGKISAPRASPTTEENTQICHIIDIRLAKKIKRDWTLHLIYYHPKTNTGKFAVTLEGHALKELQSLMSYNVSQVKLNVKFNVKLTTKTGQNIEVDLALSPYEKDGEYHHDFYHATGGVSNSEHATTVSSISSIRVWVEGLITDPIKILPNSRAKNVRKFRYQTGIDSDIAILHKIGNDDEDDAVIRANENVLCAQSSVIKTMLEEGKFKEGATREIPMTDRSKREVIVFLDYLYYGLEEDTLKDPILCSVLYEMAHYYDVKEMEQAMKYVFLAQAPKYFQAVAALRIFRVANGAEENGLKQLVVDVLKMRDEKLQFGSIAEIFKTDTNGMSELFNMYGKF